jgi:LysM domain
MRIDQSTTAPQCDRSDGDVAAQESFDQHLQAARNRQEESHARPANDNANVVIVKRGDTLWDMAHQRGTTLKDLYKANPQFDPRRQDGILHFDRPSHGGWDPDYIRPGDRIRLPSQHSLEPHPGGHRHHRSDTGSPGNPNRTRQTQNTLKPPDHSGDPNSPATPHNLNGSTPDPQEPTAPIGPNPIPNAQNTPNTPPPLFAIRQILPTPMARRIAQALSMA